MANPYSMIPQPPPPPPPLPTSFHNGNQVQCSPSFSSISDGENNQDTSSQSKVSCFKTHSSKCKQKELQFHLVGAIESGNLVQVQKLVNNGVNIDCIILLVKTPLIHAMEQGQEHIASYLISSGANTNKAERNAWFRHPLHTAVFKNMYNIVLKLLVHGAVIEAQDGNGMTPLTYSAIYGNSEITKLLVSYGANLNHEDFVNRIALHFAAERNLLDIADTLIRLGSNIDHQDKYGWSPLFGAVMYNHIEMVQLLLSRRANVQLLDYGGDGIMHLACSRFRREKVFVVLSTSEDLYKRKRRIPTLSFQNLCVKFRGSNIDIIHCLIDAGANVCLSNFEGLTPLDLCKEQNVMKSLVSVGSPIDPGWIQSATLCSESGENTEIITWLLEQFQLQQRLIFACKVAIRRYLSFTGCISSAIQKLPLPNAMKDFLQQVY
ncbi:repeat domain-containing [Octopus vulgaris]|uniref:Repeat domain-containing n=1 Tax=Octopus vulgaris TaxID=6645 RepID=A0AA36F114_OCTVU|nr:repeat domain-containing [Octopus vulgaris]